jgi:hypothetical protein
VFAKAAPLAPQIPEVETILEEVEPVAETIVEGL